MEKNKGIATLISLLELNVVLASLMACRVMLVNIVTLVMYVLFLKYKKYLPDLVESCTRWYTKLRR